jgi:hypothetical protein
MSQLFVLRIRMIAEWRIILRAITAATICILSIAVAIAVNPGLQADSAAICSSLFWNKYGSEI